MVEFRCGYFQIVGGGKVEHRYRTDFADVHLAGQPKADDHTFYLKMQKFAQGLWEAGADHYQWEGEL